MHAGVPESRKTKVHILGISALLEVNALQVILGYTGRPQVASVIWAYRRLAGKSYCLNQINLVKCAMLTKANFLSVIMVMIEVLYRPTLDQCSKKRRDNSINRTALRDIYSVSQLKIRPTIFLFCVYNRKIF
jgi:hypothetical protein